MSEGNASSTGLTAESLRFYMPAEYREVPIHIFDTLDSTNTRAKTLLADGAPHRTVVIAHQQTDGRGRLGRSFFSPREGLYLSIILRAADCGFGGGEGAAAFDRPMLVTAAAAVAVTEGIEAVCGKAAGIKWVNDIYVDEKKVCGILTEGVTDHKTGKINSLVAGIGINTSLAGFPPELLKLAGALDGDYSRAALAASIIEKILRFTEALTAQDAELKRLAGRDTSPPASAPLDFMRIYREKSIVIGKTVTVFKGAYRADPLHELAGHSAKVLDIDDGGGLCVIYTDGTRETLTSGEISIRL